MLSENVLVESLISHVRLFFYVRANIYTGKKVLNFFLYKKT